MKAAFLAIVASLLLAAPSLAEEKKEKKHPVIGDGLGAYLEFFGLAWGADPRPTETHSLKLVWKYDTGTTAVTFDEKLKSLCILYRREDGEFTAAELKRLKDLNAKTEWDKLDDEGLSWRSKDESRVAVIFLDSVMVSDRSCFDKREPLGEIKAGAALAEEIAKFKTRASRPGPPRSSPATPGHP